MGNKGNEKPLKAFEFQQFVNLALQSQEQTSQQVVPYTCKLQGHLNNQIEYICINYKCTEVSRGICKECKLIGLHQRNENPTLFVQFSQVDNIIKIIRILFLRKIDSLLYEVNIKQLKITNQEQKKINFIEFKELNNIEKKISDSIMKLNSLNSQKLQQQESVGLYDFLNDQFILLVVIEQELIEYKNRKIKLQMFQAIFNQKVSSMKLFRLRAQKLKIIQSILNSIKNNNIANKYQSTKKCKSEQQLICQSIDDLYQVGIKLEHENQFKLAIKYFDIIIQFDVYSEQAFQAFSKKLKCLQRMKQYKEAASLCEDQIQFYKRAIQQIDNKSIPFNQYVFYLQNEKEQIQRELQRQRNTQNISQMEFLFKCMMDGLQGSNLDQN